MARPPVLCTVTLLNETRATYVDEFENKVPGYTIGEDPLSRETVRRLAEWVESEERYLDGADLKLLGRHLYRFLFPRGSDADESFQKCYRAFSTQRANDEDLRLRLRVAFESDALGLAQLPWEFLVMSPDHKDDRAFFIASRDTELVLSRCILPVVPFEDPPRPLRILVVLCSPGGLNDLETQDVSRLLTTIDGLAERDGVEVKRLANNPRLSEIEDALAEEPDFKPDIFHFIGHGQPGKVAVRMEAEDHAEHYSETGDKTYEAAWIDNQLLVNLFNRDRRPRLLFLHACESATAPRGSGEARDAAAGLTDLAGIHALIAMRYPIHSDKAAAFAERFYQQIGAGAAIDTAVTIARKALAEVTSDTWGRRQATPMLYLQTDRAVILEAAGDNEQDKPRYDCPYEQLDQCPGAFISKDQKVCRRCRNHIVWCPVGHPNTSSEAECADCLRPLDSALTDPAMARSGAPFSGRSVPGKAAGSARSETPGSADNSGWGG